MRCASLEDKDLTFVATGFVLEAVAVSSDGFHCGLGGGSARMIINGEETQRDLTSSLLFIPVPKKNIFCWDQYHAQLRDWKKDRTRLGLLAGPNRLAVMLDNEDNFIPFDPKG